MVWVHFVKCLVPSWRWWGVARGRYLENSGGWCHGFKGDVAGLLLALTAITDFKQRSGGVSSSYSKTDGLITLLKKNIISCYKK